MAEPEALAPLLAALRALVGWLDAAAVCGVVIGGVAASLLGRPCVTCDVDAVILLVAERWPELLADADRSDSTSLVRMRWISPGGLLLRHRQSGIDVGVTVGSLPFEEEIVARDSRINAAGVSLPLATAET